MSGRITSCLKVDLVKLFELLESHSQWNSYYFSIENEFSDLSASVGQERSNMARNRYCNVWPWDHNRVVLQGDAHYINASHVTTPVLNCRYIATQEPLTGEYEPTTDDFWRMVWEQNCSVVVMLNDPSENNCYKSRDHYPYYPTGVAGYKEYHGYVGIEVTIRSTEDRGAYHHTQLEVSCDGEPQPRLVHHLQFKGWGDYGVPDLAGADFHEFILESRALFTQLPGKPIVHCSAGVGRTGTFILADTVLQLVQEKKSINIDLRSVLENLRGQRMWLVQTPQQLRFCVLAILEGIRAMDRSSFTNERVTV